MIWLVVGIWLVTGAFALVVFCRHGQAGLHRSGEFALSQGRALAFRLPLAMLAASFLAQVLPIEDIASIVGPNSGLVGIVLASLLGGLMPGGPMTSFPIALIVYEGGAGTAQIVALLSGWSIFAMHRVLAYEAPIMGWTFVALRMGACAILPVLAGLFTLGTTRLFEALQTPLAAF